ncbi:NAD(P)-dependent oxidoreductase, partial [Gammaproteobacteria bacterium]|nr:NAD(P)-dependent oxidoreductase [Gammaproteobacteria bacterium]
MNKKGFIGLGVMGYPMAGHLASNNFDVCVFNRTQEKALKWKNEFIGSSCESPSEIASQSDVICGNNGILESVNPGTIIIDHSTTSATLAKEINQILKEKECHFLDAPISGGQAGAEAGKLSVMVGGCKESFEAVKIILDVYSKFSKHMGNSGSGQLTKMVNQICIGGLLQALAEGMNFSEKAG